MIPNNPTCSKEWLEKLENATNNFSTISSGYISNANIKIGDYVTMPPINRRHKFLLWLAKLLHVKIEISDIEMQVTAVSNEQCVIADR
jgi:hypothetical protein